MAFIGTTQNRTVFPPKDVIKTFRDEFLKDLDDVKVEEIDRFARNYDFEAISIRSDKAHFDCKSLQGVMDFFMMHNPSKMYDESHFNMEKMEEHFKGNFVLSIPLIIGIYNKSLFLNSFFHYTCILLKH